MIFVQVPYRAFYDKLYESTETYGSYAESNYRFFDSYNYSADANVFANVAGSRF